MIASNSVSFPGLPGLSPGLQVHEHFWVLCPEP